MMVLTGNKALEVEKLLIRITSCIYNEKANPFPNFSLLEQWSALVWHEEEGKEDNSNSWINKDKFFKLVKVLSESASTKSLYLAFAHRELNENNEPLPRVILELPLEWDDIFNYESKLEYCPNQFYVFDDSLSWFIHVDDSVLLAGEPSFISSYTLINGGVDSTSEMFDRYLVDITSNDTVNWVKIIKERYLKNIRKVVY
ncbi:MAG: hypothetical protein GJ671_09575 [Alteromonadaceae bacterium]|nr:hypothetical protein [Alteromonadaceae bacterium]